MGSGTPVNIQEIITQIKSYQHDAPIAMVEQAYELARNAHSGQTRASGEEYICHPLGVAKILADLQIDALTISASLLHDVVEDTKFSLEDIEKLFGKEVAMLVDGVTKLSRIEYKSKEEQQLENFRKMFLAMAKDIRVVLIKLADRLHNMRTLKHMPEYKQRRIAQETKEIFAPLAHRLGISNIKWELEDLSFRYLEPEKYYELVEKVKQKRREREQIINEAIRILSERLGEVEIKSDIQGRPKHFYSIYKKMLKGNKDLSEIYDLSAIRILVDTVKDCYGALGVVHTLWKPLPLRFKDFIAMPKTNMYQSLHTTVIGTEGHPLEIQIRTMDMHRTSEYGIAAHWRYKEGAKGANKDFDEKLAWLRQISEQDSKDPGEFMESLKMDIFNDEVFVFTPKGDVIDLPAGSIPIDFAYRIHTDIGNRCVGARINGKMVPLETKLTNGDIVEVVTTKQGNGPSRDWLTIVGSSESKNKIRQWFKKEKREENIIKGRESIEKESKKLGYDWRELTKGERLSDAGKKFNIQTEDDLMAAIGYGGVTLHGIMAKLIEAYKKEIRVTAPPDVSKLLAKLKPHTKSKDDHGILVEGETGVMVRLAKCCNPVPGDAIVGYITRGRGVSVHRADCSNVVVNPNPGEFERMIEVYWDFAVGNLYRVTVEVMGKDRPELITDVMMVLSENKIKISSLNARVDKDNMAAITLTLDIINLNQLEHIMIKMRLVKNVYSVHRGAPSVGGI